MRKRDRGISLHREKGVFYHGFDIDWHVVFTWILPDEWQLGRPV